MDVGAGHTTVEHVPDDRDAQPGQVPGAVAQMPTHRVGVQQRLGGVLVGSVAGVDDGAVDPPRFGEAVRCARGAVADHHGVSAHGLQGQSGVFEGLPFGH